MHIDSVSLCEEIGSGGSSCIVYKCIVDGWNCAVKSMDFNEVSRYEVEQFEKEVRACALSLSLSLSRVRVSHSLTLAQIALMASFNSHPNIVRYLFHGEYNNKLCLFLQLYSTTLAQTIEQRRIPKDGLVDLEDSHPLDSNTFPSDDDDNTWDATITNDMTDGMWA